MRRFLILMLTIMLAAALVACDSGDTTTDTTAPEETTTETPTEVPTEEVTTEEATTEEATTEEATTEEEVTLPPAEETTEAWTEPEDAPYDRLLNPVISSKNASEIYGYNASGEFSFAEGDALSTTDNNMFIVTNDRMAKGKITATFTAPSQNINDNGIIFGMNEDTDEQYFFWEDGPTYYFLFVSDNCNLYLAKVSYNGQAWNEMMVTNPIYNYNHGDVITISVEFDGEGFIDCYANDEWLISVYDENWTGGTRYGIRCEVPGVVYTDVIVDHDWVPDW